MDIKEKVWPAAIQNKLQQLPKKPGVYQMLDRNNNIIYIGKSKCLKQRVKSYFQAEPKWEKAKKMQPFIWDIDFIVTDTHLEAMLLECDLIKKVRPFFNVMMKQEMRYVYLKVGGWKEPPLLTVYERETDCFGPFRSSSHLLDVVEVFRNFYPFQKVKRHEEFTYHYFPEEMNEEIFLENRDILLNLFQNQKTMGRFLRKLDQKMKQACNAMKFELAGKYRDLKQSLEYLNIHFVKYREFLEKRLLLALPAQTGYKFALVAQGRVVAFSNITTYSEEEKQIFLNSAAKKEKAPQKELGKGAIDYCDIIYREVAALPASQIEYLS